jgi:hypothetical protein
VLPFHRYPHEGKQLLGKIAGANARREYGLKLFRLTGIGTCAYCGLDLTGDYHHWLLLCVDHVVPVSVARQLEISTDFYSDAINMVLSCSGCNGFGNRYRYTPPDIDHRIGSVEEFVELRDLIFAERSQLISLRRVDEETFFNAFWKSG